MDRKHKHISLKRLCDKLCDNKISLFIRRNHTLIDSVRWKMTFSHLVFGLFNKLLISETFLCQVCILSYQPRVRPQSWLDLWCLKPSHMFPPEQAWITAACPGLIYEKALPAEYSKRVVNQVVVEIVVNQLISVHFSFSQLITTAGHLLAGLLLP